MSEKLDWRNMKMWAPESIEIMALLNDWSRAYEVPIEMIERQIPIAYGWCLSNKKKAPKKNIIRFLFNWMRLAKKHGTLDISHKKMYKEDRPPEESIMTGDDFKRMRESIGKGFVNSTSHIGD
jgi:hypothetical protein